MANIRFMSWNIENYGPGKYIDTNANPMRISQNKDHLINTIAQTAHIYNVNLMSVLEICNSCGVAICNEIIARLNAITGAVWERLMIDADGAEYYCIFYRTGSESCSGV